jgi:hypothetical protein
VARKLSWSTEISYRRVAEADAAYRFASTNLPQTPLNCFLTAHFAECGIDEGDIELYQTTLDFLEAVRDWFKRNDTSLIYIAWRENPHDDARGEHLHMALHLPEKLKSTFKTFCRKHLKAARPNAIDLGMAKTPGDLIRGYLAKGGDKRTQRDYDEIIKRTAGRDKRKGQGRIYGQRVFISRTINAKAQSRTERRLKLVPAQPEGVYLTKLERLELKWDRQERQASKPPVRLRRGLWSD